MDNPFLTFFLTLVAVSLVLAAFPFCGHVSAVYLLGFFIGVANAIFRLGNS